MMPSRFTWTSTGENLNEHILGNHWPPPAQRLEMLAGAVTVMRLLWRGGWQSHQGSDHYRRAGAYLYGGKDKPRYGQVTVCYASAEDEAARTVRRHWLNAGGAWNLYNAPRLHSERRISPR